jgi:DNA polymerase
MTEPLQYWFVDFETYYGDGYTLTTMDPPSYILDPRFEAICLGVAKGFNDPPTLVDGPHIPSFLNSLPPNVAMVSHNALFDMCIMSWRYGYVPKLIVDTLAMARTLLAHRLDSLSLGSVAKHIGLQKGDFIHNVRNMTRADIIANGLWRGYTEYCLGDTAICRAIFLHLIESLPAEEVILHDMVARCAVEPTLKLDMDVLHEHLGNEETRKSELFFKAMCAGLTDRSELMSNPQFSELLLKLGVNPPTKVSKTTGLRTWAFSRNDRAFLELLEHDDPRVGALVEARISHKSTLEETRTRRMINIGQLDFPHHGGTETMPIPLIVGAAHTHRFGGGWKLNCQNWGRESPIRKAVIAPEGHKIVAADSRQIEARMNAWFCGQDDLLEQFRQGIDVYSAFASEIYLRHVTPADKNERFVGKTGVLQLGYQAGWRNFQASVWLKSYDGVNEPITLTDDEANNVVNKYRMRYANISGMWRILPNMFSVLQGRERPVEMGPLRFEKGRVVGPNGLCLHYHNLRFENGQWCYDHGGRTYKIYGGKFLENIIQFLSRIATMQAAFRLRKPLGRLSSRLTHTSHDEIVYLAKDDVVGAVKEMLEEEMRRSPSWAKTLPLDVAIGVGLSYGDAK